MQEHEKAKAWREARGLSVAQLADLTGYAQATIYWMERGLTPPNAKRKEPGEIPWWIWKRYKMICAGVEAELKTGATFNWEKYDA